MVRRFCAWSLLLLVLSPFTAPFATCDLYTLLGESQTHSTPGTYEHSTELSAPAPGAGGDVTGVSAFRLDSGAMRSRTFGHFNRPVPGGGPRHAVAALGRRTNPSRQATLARAAVLRI